MSSHLTESKRWLKLKDAIKYSAIGRDRLKQLARNGVIIGFHDTDNARHDWIFDRLSIDSYRLTQYHLQSTITTQIANDIALEVLNR